MPYFLKQDGDWSPATAGYVKVDGLWLPWATGINEPAGEEPQTGEYTLNDVAAVEFLGVSTSIPKAVFAWYVCLTMKNGQKYIPYRSNGEEGTKVTGVYFDGTPWEATMTAKIPWTIGFTFEINPVFTMPMAWDDISITGWGKTVSDRISENYSVEMQASSSYITSASPAGYDFIASIVGQASGGIAFSTTSIGDAVVSNQGQTVVVPINVLLMNWAF